MAITDVSEARMSPAVLPHNLHLAHVAGNHICDGCQKPIKTLTLTHSTGLSYQSYGISRNRALSRIDVSGVWGFRACKTPLRTVDITAPRSPRATQR